MDTPDAAVECEAEPTRTVNLTGKLFRVGMTRIVFTTADSPFTFA